MKAPWQMALRRLGWPGALGLALLAAAAWIEREWVPAQQAQAEALSSEVRRLRHELQAKADAQAKVKQASPAQQALASPKQAWAAQWLGLPPSDSRLTLQKQVLLSAHERGLGIATVQYRGQLEPWLDKAASQGLWRQRMSMPVEGSYASLKAWLDVLLNEPSLSIDALDIQRTDIHADRVKAQVTVSLWWRQDKKARQ